MYIDYVDLPAIPEELLESPEEIIAKPRLIIGDTLGGVVPISSIQRKDINSKLADWLQSVCNFSVSAQYLLLNYKSPIHRDPPRPDRSQVYNYIVQTGGTEATTNVYDDNNNILKSVVVPAKTWYCLDTHRLHGVSGIDKDTWRILLSVNKGHEF